MSWAFALFSLFILLILSIYFSGLDKFIQTKIKTYDCE